MVTISENRLTEYFKKFRSKKIIVIGDLMLDHYLEGTVERISPEAPVPVVEVKKEYMRLGGAANVAYNLHSLGALPILIGVIGDDAAGANLMNLMKKYNFCTDHVAVDKQRPTITKTRVIANDQHVVRADFESKEIVNNEVLQKIVDAIRVNIKIVDAVIIEDYDKGLLSKTLIKKIVQITDSQKKIITVDPKFNNFFHYKSVTLFKPNRKEAEAALGKKIQGDEELKAACNSILKSLRAKIVLITLGEKGMCCLNSEGDFFHVPTKAQKVHDVSGAGDTVISALTLALTAGADLKEAVTLANYAAGAVCGDVGVVPITPEKLRRAIRDFV